MAEPILQVKDLVVEFRTRRGVVRAVDGVSFELRAGETLGLVGESGSGKSVTALSILRLLPRNATVVSGEILFHGKNVLTLDDASFRKIRGKAISLILQDPMTSLNPVFNIGWQVGEAVAIQQGVRGALRLTKVVELLRAVRISDPESRLCVYPHQLSGGMRQRVVGAAAIAGSPEILICDEPTTALDATIQAQYLELLREVQRKFNLAIIFITHDFGIVAEMCDRMAVMYAGRIHETTSVVELFDNPAHPYTRALLESVPVLGRPGRLRSIPGQPARLYGEMIGCAFAPRCDLAGEKCFFERKSQTAQVPGHWSTCWRAK